MIADRTMIAFSWNLGRLAEALRSPCRGPRDLVVRDVHEDSRRCGRGDVFVAVRGAGDDGLRHVRDALGRGAAAVISERDPGRGVPWIRVDDARLAAGRVADLLHGDPSQKLALIGVTGTNGKTTTVHLLRQILPGAVGTIGTLGVEHPGGSCESANTTPGPTDLRRHLRAMVEAGCTACAMEVSSHALTQRRVDGLRFEAAVYTNLTSDHLDYHGTREAYAAAKARLFDLLDTEAIAVLNADDPACAAIRTRARIARFRAEDVRAGAGGTEFTWRGRRVRTSLLGRHNAENAAAALAAACALGADPDDAVAALARATAARGRLEPVQRDPFLVLVDYAHTDDALDKAARAVRELAPGRLFVVFGCGGDRDRTKRPRMGAAASRWADAVVVTNDNPRSEDPERIAAEILAGVPGGRAEVILDREEAIARALAEAGPGDAVLIAGKGHETYQIAGGVRREFDDADVARRFLAGAAAKL